MLNTFRRGAVLGVILIAAGILFLLSNLGMFEIRGWLIGGLFCLGGLFFLNVFFENRVNWWAIIPGVILLDIGGLIVLSTLFPGQMGRLGGAFFLAGISLAFWLVFLRTRENWWAIIPGGILLTLASITLVDLIRGTNGLAVPGTLFLGISATFVLVKLLGGTNQNLNWAWYPAVVCGVMGLLFMLFAGQVGGLIVPVALILLGVFLVGKTLIKKEIQ